MAHCDSPKRSSWITQTRRRLALEQNLMKTYHSNKLSLLHHSSFTPSGSDNPNSITDMAHCDSPKRSSWIVQTLDIQKIMSYENKPVFPQEARFEIRFGNSAQEGVASVVTTAVVNETIFAIRGIDRLVPH
ncbi:hypothetical protein CEXT_655041 [Caerostris extrusa]|uniref:Uncharacterized protein n=1 Tax=Caerostris extrusa TaxID=172846 RepID=A0AAV4M7H3_CAEEX|nr:hypothetical protein CEXT_655041 [Caerostris extrusa]